MKKVLFGLVIFSTLLLSLGFFFIFKPVSLPVKNTEPLNVLESPDEIPATEFSGRDSILNLALLNKTMQCTFVFSTDNYKGEGSAFFDRGSARFDSLYSQTNTDLIASFIILDKNSTEEYSWSLASEMSEVKKTVVNASAESNDRVSLSTMVQYVCHDWVVDGSVFVPPDVVDLEASSSRAF